MARVPHIRNTTIALLNENAGKTTDEVVAILAARFGWTDSNAKNAIRWNAANSGTPLPPDWKAGRAKSAPADGSVTETLQNAAAAIEAKPQGEAEVEGDDEMLPDELVAELKGIADEQPNA